MVRHDKLFKGLVHHLTMGCDGCPYDKKNPDCWNDLARDALDFIEMSVSRDLFLEVLKKYIDAETGLIYEYSGNFAKSFKELNETVDEYLIRSGVASDNLKRYKEDVGIEEKGGDWDA